MGVGLGDTSNLWLIAHDTHEYCKETGHIKYALHKWYDLIAIQVGLNSFLWFIKDKWNDL